MSQQIKLIWSQVFTVKRCVLYLLIILGLPVLQFSFIYEGYQFFLPIEVFEETLSGTIPMLFPVLAVLIFCQSSSLNTRITILHMSEHVRV